MRTISKSRNTKETKIDCKINLDGSGSYNISTGVGFFDHMLCQLSKHSFIDMDIKCEGDTNIDCHHTVEDVGIVLGKCIVEALGDKSGIRRYGDAIIPMDETLVMCALDLSGRAYLGYDVTFTTDKIGDMATESLEEFFRALTYNGAMNLHIKVLDGKNNHHIAEGMFKAVAKALDEALSYDERIKGTLSTKGSLEG